jgi:hypothetical protein
MSDGYGLEKRKFFRLDTPLEATVTIIWHGTDTPRAIPPLQLHCRNISHQGICLETASLQVSGISLLEGRPCARDNRLHLTIPLIAGEPDFQAVAEARWYDVLRQPGGGCLYQLGIEFVEMLCEDKLRLQRFLKQKEPAGFIGKLFHHPSP